MNEKLDKKSNGKWIRFGSSMHDISDIKGIDSRGSEITVHLQNGNSFYQCFESYEDVNAFFDSFSKFLKNDEILLDITDKLKKWEFSNVLKFSDEIS